MSEIDTLQPENRLEHIWSTEAHEVKTKPGTVWARKKQLIPPPDLSDIEEKLELGRTFQEPIMRVWASRHKVDFQEADYAMYHPTVAMASHFDYIQSDKTRLFEVKNVGFHASRQFGEPGSDHVPIYYRDQCLHEATVHGIPAVTMVVCMAGQEIQHFDLQFSTDEMESHAKEMARFWAMVKTDVQPEDLPEEAIRQMYPVSRPSTVMATQAVLKAIGALKIYKANEKQIEEQVSQLRNTIVSYMGHNDTLADVDGSILATFKSAKGSKKFNMDRFKEENPSLYEMYVEDVQGSRRFLVK
jgi:hypothetical protein